LEIRNYLSTLSKEAGRNRLSRGNPTLERNSHRENELPSVGCCVAFSKHFHTCKPVRQVSGRAGPRRATPRTGATRWQSVAARHWWQTVTLRVETDSAARL
jgi:hypothetical protein